MDRHEPYCYDDDGKIDCACGLAEVAALLTDRELAQYEAGRQVFVDLTSGEAWL